MAGRRPLWPLQVQKDFFYIDWSAASKAAPGGAPGSQHVGKTFCFKPGAAEVRAAFDRHPQLKWAEKLHKNFP